MKSMSLNALLRPPAQFGESSLTIPIHRQCLSIARCRQARKAHCGTLSETVVAHAMVSRYASNLVNRDQTHQMVYPMIST